MRKYLDCNRGKDRSTSPMSTFEKRAESQRIKAAIEKEKREQETKSEIDRAMEKEEKRRRIKHRANESHQRC